MSANASVASYSPTSELAEVAQSNTTKSDTGKETPKQSQPPATKQKEAKPAALEEVLVTGSRIPLTAGEGAQGVKIYTREEIDQSGGTTLAEFLNTLPDVKQRP